jgi:hypothetical protein
MLERAFISGEILSAGEFFKEMEQKVFLWDSQVIKMLIFQKCQINLLKL